VLMNEHIIARGGKKAVNHCQGKEEKTQQEKKRIFVRGGRKNRFKKKEKKKNNRGKEGGCFCLRNAEGEIYWGATAK